MNTYLVLRRSGWSSPVELEKAAGRASRVCTQEMAERVVWIRSYVIREPDGRLGIACIVQATDEQTVHEHARRARLRCDEVIPVEQTVILNDDPLPAA